MMIDVKPYLVRDLQVRLVCKVWNAQQATENVVDFIHAWHTPKRQEIVEPR